MEKAEAILLQAKKRKELELMKWRHDVPRQCLEIISSSLLCFMVRNRSDINPK